MEEVELIQRIRQKDEAAFALLFDAYHKKALRTACFIAGNEADGEDIVQETFVKCYLNIASLKNDACFASWFYQVLTRTAWDVAKKRKKETPVAEIYTDGTEPATPSALEQFLEHDQSQALYVQISKLDLKHRTTIILYYYNELSIKEIAAAMNCMEGTVKSRLHTARQQLKNWMGTGDKQEMGVRQNAKCKPI